jgi:ribosomal protein S18 acetylase RimI-like enzyme
MDSCDLVFRPIDLDQHRELFLTFIRDTHLCSFGSMDSFPDDIHGEELLIERIQKKLTDKPQSCLHIWQNEQIVGQLHLGQLVDPDVGYINLLYVIPEWRGGGIASLIEDYASAYLQGQGFESARLSVTAQNHRAIRFYSKKGWKDLGPRADRPIVHNMEKVFGLPPINNELF